MIYMKQVTNMDNKIETNKSEKNEGNSLDDQVKALRPIEYIRTVNAYLLKGNKRSAYAVVQRAFVMHPEDTFILSYYGFLQAVVDKKYRSGVDNCTKAIAMLKRKTSPGKEILYPLLYLNLGRAYMAAGKKKHAVVAFNQGLHHDAEYSAIRKELQKLGMRKRLAISFLDRSNPVNKYLGKVLNRKSAQKKQQNKPG